MRGGSQKRRVEGIIVSRFLKGQTVIRLPWGALLVSEQAAREIEANREVDEGRRETG